MAPRTPLAQYVLDRITERGETTEAFAARIGINASGLYKFLRGAYSEPRQGTLDKIAAGLNMTPADLMVAVGRGAVDADPDEAEFLALIRQVPKSERFTVKSMLRGIAGQRGVTKSRRKFGNTNADAVQQPLTRKRYQSQSVATQISRYGFMPATT